MARKSFRCIRPRSCRSQILISLENLMTIFRKSLAEYVRFCRLFFILIPIIGIVRLALSLSGTPNSTDKWLSVTAVVWLGVIYNSIRVHTRGFGAYKQLLVICVLLNCIGQLVISCGILLAIFTGTPNIYSAPEYAPGGNGAS